MRRSGWLVALFVLGCGGTAPPRAPARAATRPPARAPEPSSLTLVELERAIDVELVPPGTQVEDECSNAIDDDADGAIDEGCAHSFGGRLAITASWDEPMEVELLLEREADDGGWAPVDVERWDVEPCALGFTKLAGIRPSALAPGRYRILARPGAACRTRTGDWLPIYVVVHFDGAPVGGFALGWSTASAAGVASFRLVEADAPGAN